MINSDIFCAVTACNEKFLDRMIEDAYAKASDPDRVYFGIFNQKSEKKEFEDFSLYKNVKVINAHYKSPLGVAYGRLSAAMLHEGQKYFSQMDGHLLFYKNWDEILISNYEMLKKYVDKPILAQSVISHDQSVYRDYTYQNSLTDSDKAYPLKLNSHGDTTSDTSRENEEKFLGKFLEHTLMFACAEFMTSSEYIYEISYDPFIMYLPEQEISALRAGSRGYRFFSCGQSTMSHLSKIHNFPKQKFNEDFFYVFNNNDDKSEYYRYSYERSAYAALLGKRTGFFGAPDNQSYDEYMSRFYVKYSDTIRSVYEDIEEVYADDIKSKNVFYRNLK